MRRGYTDRHVIEGGGKFIGIALGFDWCAEHERGTDGIKKAFGIPEKPTDKVMGVNALTVQTVPDGLVFKKFGKYAHLIYSFELAYPGYIGFRNPDKEFFDYALRIKARTADSELVTAWDEKSFGIRLENDDDGVLKQLYDAILRKDALIYQIAKTNPFGGAGLAVMIRSRIPETHILAMAETDKDFLVLQRAFEKTGIEKKLAKAEKEYSALRPEWADETKKSLKFFLNPRDQQNNNRGWFTLKDLESWIRGEGPIPKDKSKKK